MPRFPKGSQEAKDYMASIRAKKGSGVSGSKDDGGEKKPLIPRPSKLKDTDDVRQQLQTNRYTIAREIEKALKEKKITKADRDSLLNVLETPYMSGDKDVNKIAESQNEAFMGLMERSAKKGSGMGSCSGGSAVSGNPSAPSGPPPPPPPRPPRPSLAPINTSIDPDQSLINGIEELLASTTLSQARRKQLMEELKRIKERVSGNPQSGSGIIPIFKKPKERVSVTLTDPSIYGNETIGERLAKKIEIAKATQAGIIKKDNLEKKKKSKMYGRGASASVSAQSIQDQINRKIMERSRIIARMATLQREIEDVITTPGPTPMEERMNSISSVLTETGILTQRLNTINAELEALGARMFEADTDSEGGDTERETDSFEGSGMVSSILKKKKVRVSPDTIDYSADPTTDPEFLALMAESERVMNEMKKIIEKGKKKGKMKGGGGGASKEMPIVPALEQAITMDYDDRIGSTERIARATPIASAPEATAYPVNQDAMRKRLKELQKELKERQNAKKNTEERMANNDFFAFGDTARTRLIEEVRLERINEDILNLTELINTIMIELEPSVVASIVGSGIIKPLPKGFKGGGVVRF